ncbi:MAG: VWA domain-containing protein, partial [Vicinamibacteria bacterium]|nr:VWA domain-containing protein [Vicinamibacteria bacterium]
ALLAWPILLWLRHAALRSDQARVAAFVARSLLTRVATSETRTVHYLRVSLLSLAYCGFALALARPQWGIVREKIEREGVDVILALDSSASMATEDAAPNRFFLARSALTSLVSQLEGDRIGLLAFEGEAYPLAPLTLDADAVGLFLETLEPGAISSPGTSLGVGLDQGLKMFVDQDRRNKVMVLVSDGEDLEGQVAAAITRAKQAGVVVHTVGVGSEQGQPVPEYDREGRRAGFKKGADGSVVVSRLNMANLEAIARGTGGRFFRITPADTNLGALAAAIAGLEQRSLAREFSYRMQERYAWPLGAALAALAFALVLPLPRLSWYSRRARAARVKSETETKR